MGDIQQAAAQDYQANNMTPVGNVCNAACSIPQLMRATLDDLSNTDHKRFKIILKERSEIPWGKLKDADTDDIVEQMVQRYCEEVSAEIMLIMKMNKLAKDLKRNLDQGNPRPLSEVDVSSKEGKSSSKHHLQSILKDKYYLIREELGNNILQDIFTELSIVKDPTGGVNSAHELSTIHLKQIEPSTNPGNVNSVKLSNIFSDHLHAGKPVTRVLTLGIAGVGKTVAVQKFAMDWAEERNNHHIELVFVFPCRELNMYKEKKNSLFELLFTFYPELEELKEFKTEFKTATILFIFDGLDESRFQLGFGEHIRDPEEKSSISILMTSLITGKLMTSALIWVTTRPAVASKELCDLFHLVTEIQGFNDTQKIQYFQRIIPEKAEQIITHIKSKRNLYTMCHIPVFCRITASVWDLGDERWACDQEMPKTLTEMYTRFCVFQITRMNEKYLKEKKMSSKEKGQLLVKLGKLAFKHLEKGTLIFYEKDLTECDIDVNTGTLQTGLCTQIFKKESAVSGESMFSFVHLSIQEFLAALYILHTHTIHRKNLLTKTPLERINCRFKNSRFDLYKMTLRKALQSQNGHLDLCVRFLLGLASMLEPEIHYPLDVVLPQLAVREESIKKTVQYIMKIITENILPERTINLFHCLNELGDNSLVEEINRYMSSGNEEKNLTPAQCSALAYLLLMSSEDFEEFDLKMYQRSDGGLHRMLPVVKLSRKVWLNHSNLSKASCKIMISVLQGTPSHLRELDMSDNDLRDEGVELLCVGLRHPQCRLESLRLNCGKISKASCEMMASVLQSSPSHLRELDMGNNDLQDEGVELLCVGLRDPQCKLETLRLSLCLITHKGCSLLASALRSNPTYLKKLNLSYNHPGDSGVLELKDRLNDPNCKLLALRYDHGSECRIEAGPRKYACELRLNTMTAHRRLFLSEGNRKVAYVIRQQQYRDYPERFDSWEQVLCREGLSGRCYWEAEWNGFGVDIAVTYKSIQRKGRSDNSRFGCNDESWHLQCFIDHYSAWHSCKKTEIPTPSSRSNRVGVYLDWPAGTLSFYSVSSDTLTHLHTFHSTFTEPLYPGFGVWQRYSSVSLCQII